MWKWILANGSTWNSLIATSTAILIKIKIFLISCQDRPNASKLCVGDYTDK
jgi:hypothetical protein